MSLRPMSALRPTLVLAAVLALLAPPASRAQDDVPRTMTFQGRLVRADGTPESTPQDLVFALYATPTGGAAVWQEVHLGVPMTNGYYAVVLGSSAPLRDDVVRRGELYLGVALTGQSELTPRLRMAAVPFALRASDSERLGGRAAASFADSTHPHAVATSTAEGFMPAADKAKLDALPSTFGEGLTTSGATLRVNFPTSGSGTNGTSTQAARANHSHATATTSAAGFMSAADKAKLDAPGPTYGDGLTVTTGTPATVSVRFANSGGNLGTATTVARSDHSHPRPSLACTYRTATGNDSNDIRASIAWCATGETLTGGGCGDLSGEDPGLAFLPTGVTFENGSTSSTGSPGYRCRSVNSALSPPTAYAICCRIP